MPTTVWSITGGISAYRPACQALNSQFESLPVTLMIQSSAAEVTLRKCGTPSMRNVSKYAPDLASAGRTATRSVASATSSSRVGAMRGATSGDTVCLHPGEEVVDGWVRGVMAPPWPPPVATPLQRPGRPSQARRAADNTGGGFHDRHRVRRAAQTPFNLVLELRP
jgi:hypothetical protein